jgi:hypothetical protein
MKLKVEQVHVYDLVTVCFDYAGEIQDTRFHIGTGVIFGPKDAVGK